MGRVVFDQLATPDSPLRAVPAAVSEAARVSVGAVGLSDAVSILRMALGLDGTAADAGSGDRVPGLLRQVAADMDADGQVNLRDALSALRVAAAAPTEPSPSVDMFPAKWAFLSDRDLAAGLSADRLSSRSYLPTVSSDGSDGVQVGLIAVLRGDVDASWSQGLSSSLLNEAYPDHAHALQGLWAGTPALFGVYGA
jgi:hypothetical protein